MVPTCAMINKNRLSESESKYQIIFQLCKAQFFCIWVLKGNIGPDQINTKKKKNIKEQDINRDNILPIIVVFVDNYILQDPERLCYKNGRSDTSQTFLSVCVFVYHARCCMIINNNVDINATENVKEKLTFEGESQSNLVAMEGNQNYNGSLNASEFMV